MFFCFFVFAENVDTSTVILRLMFRLHVYFLPPVWVQFQKSGHARLSRRDANVEMNWTWSKGRRSQEVGTRLTLIRKRINESRIRGRERKVEKKRRRTRSKKRIVK